MAYTANELIARAYYLSGIVAKDEQVPTGSQINEGLALLNAVLAIKTADKRLIPYYTFYEFDPEVGVGDYYIPNLIEVSTLTFNNQTVRYSSVKLNRDDWFGSPRIDGVNSLPFSWHFERQLGGGTIYLYFIPDQVYPIKIMGKFSFGPVTLAQDLSISMEPFFIEYLRYALAENICQEYGIDVPPQTAKKLESYELKIKDISPLDLTMVSASAFSSRGGISYADVNIGRGLRPGGGGW